MFGVIDRNWQILINEVGETIIMCFMGEGSFRLHLYCPNHIPPMQDQEDLYSSFVVFLCIV